ncbi:hypothetical protein NLU13_3820 [Sarocladium strictum]|uniref:Peptidase S54 rhomboid domain-containing protein n=1 Tax=Sarocladium strictum TaxID=5046 RepID=A0AA39L8D3_SARSR|nr:hypothetical protein NLU13_3820 [Sarocladium strictum]
MSYWLCPRAAAQPLLRLATRAPGPVKGPAREALRWLATSTTAPKRTICTRLLSTATNRPRCTASPTTCFARGAFNRRTFFTRRIAKKYEDLPANYRDEFGLDFRAKELSQEEVDRVFRRGSISADDANTLLRILHGRRVAGTLEDPAYAENTAQFSEKQIEAALDYLRITVPVDEALNAGLRAEVELAEIEEEEELRGQGISPTEKGASSLSTFKIKPLYKTDPVYGESRFDQIRAENEAKSAALEAARQARQRAEEEAAGGAEALERARAGPVALIKEDGGKIMNPKIAEYYMKAQEQGDIEPEFVSFWQRVLPSLTVVTLVIGFLAAVTTVYEEPADTYRMMRSLSTAQATVCALIGANIIVWLGWKVPPLWGLFNRYMILVVGKVKPVTLLTANFSHQKLTHLLMNMVPLYFVGTALHEEIDRAQFLTLYMACGAAGYLSSLVVYTLRGWLSVSSLGASGCTLGVLTAYFWGHRDDGYRLFGLPQDGVPGIVLLALVVAPQLAYFGKAMRSKIDLASHLGGMTMGLVGMEVLQRRRRFTQGQGQTREDGVMSEVKTKTEVEGKDEGDDGKKEEERRHIDVFGWLWRGNGGDRDGGEAKR